MEVDIIIKFVCVVFIHHVYRSLGYDEIPTVMDLALRYGPTVMDLALR